ncbi:MAG: hypothetical protein PHF67_02195 [Candidatus Nanoarchaeia archaeon]|nr:hypothetical protein [Candidatus Nanoarchaeia archaeon]
MAEPQTQYEAWRVDYEEITAIPNILRHVQEKGFQFFQIDAGKWKGPVLLTEGDHYSPTQTYHYGNSSLSIGDSYGTKPSRKSVALLFMGLDGQVEKDVDRLIESLVVDGLHRERFSKRKITVE